MLTKNLLAQWRNSRRRRQFVDNIKACWRTWHLAWMQYAGC